jgi:hypothetical protein
LLQAVPIFWTERSDSVQPFHKPELLMTTKKLAVLLLFLADTLPVICQDSAKAAKASETSPILWRQPTDIRSRNLLYGAGGADDQPQPPLKFIKEDLHGTSPKFTAEDRNGVKWTVKIGIEAKPETAAAHLLWAVGYFTDEDYLLKQSEISDLPEHLKRGEKFVAWGGLRDVRLKRHPKKIGEWRWKQNPFSSSREFNGLRVMMALVNNWDLKDENNAIEEGHANHGSKYLVSDLGASFGTTGFGWSWTGGKGNLKSYRHSKFISKATPKYVNFGTPSRPTILYFVNLPGLIKRLHMRWIGRQIPREDAKWMGTLLAQLSPDQIRDAFRSAGFSPEEVAGFSTVVQQRITELNNL